MGGQNSSFLKLIYMEKSKFKLGFTTAGFFAI